MIIDRKIWAVSTLVLAFVLASPAQSWAQGKAKAGNSSGKSSGGSPDADGGNNADDPLYNCRKARGRVSVSFKPEIELKDLIGWAMGFTCKNFVYGTGVGGRSAKVTIIAPKRMTSRQAWDVFLVALHTMGLTVVPKGNVLKIVEVGQSKKDSIPIYRNGTPAANDQLVRVVVRPEHMSVEDLAAALNAVISKEGQVTALPRAGALLVTDYGTQLSRMRTLIRELDRPVPGERLYMIKVKYADVTELAAKLTEIVGTKDARTSGSANNNRRNNRNNRSNRNKRNRKKGAAGGSADVEVAVPSKILADERTNALIVLGSEPAYRRVHALASRLDVAVDVEGGGRIHVYYLDNADAEEMATTLTSVISGVSQPSSNQRGGRGNNRQPRRAVASASGSPAFEGQVRVTQDAPTNSLVVVASVKDFVALRDVIRKLDAARRQVFIEAMILEINIDDSQQFGFSFHGGKDLSSGSLLIGGLQHSSLQSLNTASLATSTGLLGGAVGPLLDNANELLGTSIPSFGLLFQALATNSNINVLSSPHILTTDNAEAEISVGQNIPYQSSVSSFGGGTGGQAGGGAFGFPLQSIQRQDVALTLKITPHINASDMVRLEIDQEISDIASPDFQGNGPSWSKRTIKTTVVVKDQQSVVIGGLMGNKTTTSESKIPLLGDIPLLGYLFKYTESTKQKTNLLILLTPYVIKDQMDIEAIVQQKIRERREFMRSFSTFSQIGYEPNIDYRRKRGLVEEVNHMVRLIEQEEQLLHELDQKTDEFKDGPIEYGHEEKGDGESHDDDVATSARSEDTERAKPVAKKTKTAKTKRRARRAKNTRKKKRGSAEE